MRRERRLAPILAAATSLLLSATPTTGWAAHTTSLTNPTLSADGACTSASPSSFSFTYSATGDTADFGANDYIVIYLVDGAGTVLYRGQANGSAAGGVMTNTVAFPTNVTPTTQTLTLHLVDDDDNIINHAVGDTFASTPATSVSFDANALDADCPLDNSGGGDDSTTSSVANSVQNLAASRATTVVSRLPQLATRLSGPSAPSGGVNGSGNSGQGVASFDLGVGGLEGGRLEFGAWASGYYSYVIDDAGSVEFETHIGVAQAGVDVRLSKRFLLGLMLQGDLSRQVVSGAAGGDSIGFLAGPYAVYEPIDNIYIEALAALGRADNEVTDAAGNTGDYSSDRLLVSGKISGAWKEGPWRITPGASLAYYAERSEAFTDSGGSSVAGSTQSLTQARVGPDIAYRIELEEMSVTPSVGFRGVYSATRGGASTASSGGSGADGYSLSLSTGLDMAWESATLGLGATVDGVGASEQTAYTGMATLRIAF